MHKKFWNYYSEYKAVVPKKDGFTVAFEGKPKKVNMVNARILQREAESPAAFFEKYGFCLLQHDTKVKDWDTEISSVYHAEVDQMMKT